MKAKRIVSILLTGSMLNALQLAVLDKVEESAVLS